MIFNVSKPIYLKVIINLLKYKENFLGIYTQTGLFEPNLQQSATVEANLELCVTRSVDYPRSGSRTIQDNCKNKTDFLVTHNIFNNVY